MKTPHPIYRTVHHLGGSPKFNKGPNHKRQQTNEIRIGKQNVNTFARVAFRKHFILFGSLLNASHLPLVFYSIMQKS